MAAFGEKHISPPASCKPTERVSLETVDRVAERLGVKRISYLGEAPGTTHMLLAG